MAGRRFLLKGYYKLPFLTAIWARHIMTEPYTFRLVWINQDIDVTQAKVERNADMTCNITNNQTIDTMQLTELHE